jgi:hypothetical protein
VLFGASGHVCDVREAREGCASRCVVKCTSFCICKLECQTDVSWCWKMRDSCPGQTTRYVQHRTKERETADLAADLAANLAANLADSCAAVRIKAKGD